MDTGDTLCVRHHSTEVPVMVTVATVGRGRVTVRWPPPIPEFGDVATEYGVDLLTGHLYRLPHLTSGTFSVDLHTGRIAGTRARVDAQHLSRLDQLAPGSSVTLDTGATAQVVDVLPSEGILTIFVPRRSGSGIFQHPQRLEFRVGAADLRALRESAGCVAAAS